MGSNSHLTTLHRLLISDTYSQSRYRQVLQKRVKEGDRVLDLGTGLGTHALFACFAGASRVYAVEKDEIIELAKDIARANGFADRIVFIRGRSSQVQLPEKVDVIVTHLGFDGTLRSLIDAKERFLKEDGLLIPSALELFCVPLEWPAIYDEVVEFWDREHYGLNFSALRRMAVNETHWRDFTSNQFLAEPVRVARMDLLEAREARTGGEATFEARRQGILHGVGAWYTLWLDEDTPLSTAPPLVIPSPLWGQSFFPIERPVEIQRGDRIAVGLKTFAFTAAGTVWKWEVRVEGRGTRATFGHSSFLPLSLESLHKQAPSYAPPLTPLGRAARLTLSLCDGATPLSEIEHEVFRKFGPLFRDKQEAAAFVAEILRRHTT